MRKIVIASILALSGCTATIAPIQSDAAFKEAVAKHEQAIAQIVEALNPILKERNAKVKETKNDK